MIRLPDTAALTPIERHGLALLVDLSRLLPAEGVETVRLRVQEGGPSGLAALASDPDASAGEVRLGAALLRTIGELGCGAAEQGTTARDRLGRVPSAVNPFVVAGSETAPALSRFAARFRGVVARAAEGRPFRSLAPWPDGRRWAAVLTHDLDVVALWPAFTALRVAELARKGEWSRVARTLAAAAGATFSRPILDCVQGILAAEREHGARSTWYILCGTPTFATFRAGDLTYRPESSATRRILAEVAREGHEIGLHGSLETARTPARFADQRARLWRIAPSLGSGVRQHFLRMDPGATQVGMAAAGFTHDATWGFSDRNGFRLGVADVVPWFDTASGRSGALDVVPFCWMDRTQSKYEGVEAPAEWVRVALERAAACRATEGLWSGIWHPNLVDALGYPGAADAYRALVAGLAAFGDGWLVPAGEAVAWRRRRREARGVGIDAGGAVTVNVPPGGAALVLEDADGRARERIVG